MKRVLIINAGPKQTVLAQWAKQKGYHVTVADSRPDMPAFAVADEILPVAPFERAKLLEAAVAGRFDAVTYATNETPIPAVWEIGRKLNLPMPLTRKAVDASTDKLAMRKIFDAAGINDVPYAEVRDVDAVRRFVKAHGYPAVLKPCSLGNQIGLRFLEADADLDAVRSDGLMPDTAYLIERGVPGTEVNAAVLVVGGAVRDSILSDRLHFDGRHKFVAYEHRYPSTLPKRVLEALQRKVRAVCQALELRHAVIFIQFIASADATAVLELGVRVPGGLMWQVFRYAAGIDLMETQLEIAVNREFSAAGLRGYDRHSAVCVRFLSGPPGPLPVGRFAGIDGLEAAREMPGIKFADYYSKIRIPDRITPIRDGSDRFFAVTSVGSDYTEARARNCACEAQLRFKIEADGAPAVA
ncbi:MAG: hypothetical protein JW951_10375 [Lentisphaerae bacterium]|nr:hypothetical protein [Lentisphaerota bacterium]